MMKRDVKKLIRDARFEPVSKDLDDRMEKLFESSARNLHSHPRECGRSVSRSRFALAGFAAGIILIFGVIWQNFRNIQGNPSGIPASGIIDRSTSAIARDQLSNGGVAIVFTSEKVVLRRMFTAFGTDRETVFKKQLEAAVDKGPL